MPVSTDPYTRSLKTFYVYNYTFYFIYIYTHTLSVHLHKQIKEVYIYLLLPAQVNDSAVFSWEHLSTVVKQTAFTISFSNALYPGCNQMNLICYVTHLQISVTLIHTKQNSHLSSPITFQFSEDYLRNKDPFLHDIFSL